ncbi:MAG: pilus (MSHA type) biogenesis protein MshL [Paucibacter sp.]|nr:pilus (MSHA type) biogenesis protein MshL [Roseateles sp.]
MLPPLNFEAPVVKKPELRFNLAVDNAPISQVLNAIVLDSSYSVLIPPELTGSVSLNLKNVTVHEALDALRELYGYDFAFRGQRVTVRPNSIQNRIFRINYLAGRRAGLSETRVTGSSPTSGVSPNGAGPVAAAGSTSAVGTSASSGAVMNDSSRVRTSSEFDFWKDLDGALRTIVGELDGRRVIINPESGVVLVRAMPAELRAVDDYLHATQLVVERQVMLEAKIIQVSLSNSYQTGINWSKLGKLSFGVVAPGATLGATGTLVGSTAGLTGSMVTQAGGLGGLPSTLTAGTTVSAGGAARSLGTDGNGNGFAGLAFQSNDFAAVLSFLEGQGDVQVLSSPRIATTNNQKAVLKVGTDDYFVTGISGSATQTSSALPGGTVAPSIPDIKLQPFFSGIALDVTPQIDDDGNIILHVHPSVSVVEERHQNINLGQFGNFTLPLASSNINETDSVVRVQDGTIVAIGGLMSQQQTNNRSGLPGLSALPGVGALFGQKAGLNNKSELVILIRSTVIVGDSSWKEGLADSRERVEQLSSQRRPVMGWQ